MLEEYEKALTHVTYEYAALESAYNLTRTATKTPPLIAAFDSFLVHYRSLVEFFHTKEDWRSRFEDDIRAEHYVSGWTTPEFKEWTRWKDRMHILLAHLSTKRNDAEGFDHRTHFQPMLCEVRAAWDAFSKGLTGTSHKDTLDSQLEHHRNSFTRIS